MSSESLKLLSQVEAKIIERPRKLQIKELPASTFAAILVLEWDFRREFNRFKNLGIFLCVGEALANSSVFPRQDKKHFCFCKYIL